jgi:hypothetical protein
MVRDKIITPQPLKSLTLSKPFLPILDTKKFGPILIHSIIGGHIWLGSQN